MSEENNLETINDKDEEIANVDEENATDESLNTEGNDNTQDESEGKAIPYNRFKEKVDEANALKKRLDEIEKEQAKKERQELEKQNEYKTLYEQAQQEVANIKADALNAKKDALLSKAGYTEEQVEVLRSIIFGESDEEIAKAIEDLTGVISPKNNYIDPTPLGGGSGKPKPTDQEELGRNAVTRVLNKIKL